MQCVQCCDDIAEVYSVQVDSKQAVDDHNFICDRMLAESVRGSQHIRGSQWRAHSSERASHIVAQPTRRNPAPCHLDLL
jgi:hypothetical protein